MSEKIKVSNEISRALDFIKLHFSFDEIMEKQTLSNWLGDELFCLNRLSAENIARLLIFGYETEETTEEKILRNYEGAIKRGKEDREDRKFWNGLACGIKQVLDFQGVKIKGINE